MKHLPSVLQLAGLALLALIAGVLWPPAGFIVLGVELVYVGHVLEEDVDARQPPKD